MAKIQYLLLVVLTSQIYVNAAPSDVSKLENSAKVKTAELESNPTLVEESDVDTASSQGQRQKRWYDFGGFGFPPPINPVYPNFVKRDESQNTGVYGLVEDPITQVYRRIQDIATAARQPNYPPPFPPHFPIYLPVIYLPQACNCSPQTTSQTNNRNGTMPGINNRFPEMDDSLQNWGYVDDEETNDGNEDVSRPINFNPIPPNITIHRPPPPVEHGSVQGNGNSNSVNSVSGSSTTTTRRPPPPNVPKLTPNELPTNCDAAVLSCCHQPEITLECFTTQGCPDVSSYGNPCEPSVILRVIERFQKFYLQRTG